MDRGKRVIKRSVVVDGRGILLGSVTAPINHYDSPLLASTIDSAQSLRMVAQGASVHLDRGYDLESIWARLLERGFVAEISAKGSPTLLKATKR